MAQTAPPPDISTFCFGELASLGVSAPTQSSYCRQALACLGESFAARYGRIYVQWGSQTIEHSYHQTEEAERFFAQAVEKFITESLAECKPRARLYKERAGEGQITILAAPILASDVSGVIVLVIESDSPETTRDRLMELSQYSAFVGEFLYSPSSSQSAAVAPGGTANSQGSGGAAGEILKKAASYSSWQELAFTVTNRLQSKTESDQVALGRVVGKRVKVVSISGLDRIKSQTPGLRAIQQAMEECLDHGEPIVNSASPEIDGTEGNLEFRLHARWRHETGSQSVVSIPLILEGKPEYVLSLRRSRGGYPPEEIESYQSLVEPYAGALVLLERATRSVARHNVTALQSIVAAILGRQHWGLKIATLSLILFGCWFAFGTLDHSIKVTAQIAPWDLHNFVAPEDARLVEVPVVAGDSVRKGELLCRFDTSELELERDRLKAEKRSSLVELRNAQVERDRVKIKILEADIHRYELQVAILEQRIEQMVVRAPDHGRIVEGDLRDRIGDILPKGEPLFRVAPDAQWRVTIEVPEEEAADFQHVERLSFTSYARPEESYDVDLVRFQPSAVARPGRNVFLAEARAEKLPDWMRPGMKGIAKVELGEKPVWWILSRKVLSALRLNFLI